MQGFRDLLKGGFGKVLLAIFIMPFAFFGIQGLFQVNDRDDTAIVVDGSERLSLQARVDNEVLVWKRLWEHFKGVASAP